MIAVEADRLRTALGKAPAKRSRRDVEFIQEILFGECCGLEQYCQNWCEEQQLALCRGGLLLSVLADTQIYAPGEEASQGYIVLTGRVRQLFCEDEMIGPGEILGEESFASIRSFENGHMSSAVADTDCDLVMIPRKVYLEAKHCDQRSLSFEEKCDFLKQVAVLDRLDVSRLRSLASVAQERRYSKNIHLLKEGTKAVALDIIVSGSVALKKKIAHKKKLHLFSAGSGDYIGESALLSPDAIEQCTAIVDSAELVTLRIHDISTFDEAEISLFFEHSQMRSKWRKQQILLHSTATSHADLRFQARRQYGTARIRYLMQKETHKARPATAPLAISTTTTKRGQNTIHSQSTTRPSKSQQSSTFPRRKPSQLQPSRFYAAAQPKTRKKADILQPPAFNTAAVRNQERDHSIRRYQALFPQQDTRPLALNSLLLTNSSAVSLPVHFRHYRPQGA